LLSAPQGFVPAESDSNRVRAGALEGSNTDAAQEMIDLVALSRQFESLSRVVQTYDDMLGRTIQKLGDL
jgi:flagellar basal body rod protein FlgG